MKSHQKYSSRTWRGIAQKGEKQGLGREVENRGVGTYSCFVAIAYEMLCYHASLLKKREEFINYYSTLIPFGFRVQMKSLLRDRFMCSIEVRMFFSNFLMIPNLGLFLYTTHKNLNLDLKTKFCFKKRVSQLALLASCKLQKPRRTRTSKWIESSEGFHYCSKVAIYALVAFDLQQF